MQQLCAAVRVAEAQYATAPPSRRDEWRGRLQSARSALRRLQLQLALLCVLTACASQEPRFDAGFTTRDESVILQAGESWCAASHGLCCPNQLGLRYQVITSAECETLLKAPCVAWHWRPYRTIALASEALVTWPFFRRTVLHEQGHACGLPHTLDPTALMYVGPNQAGIGPADLAALEAIQ